MVEYDFPVTLGRDFAGVVEAVGSSVTRYQPGDEVYGFLPLANPAAHDGSWADYAVVREETSVGLKPSGVDFVTAGAAPVAALTAIAAVDALELGTGTTVLVVGASGGVGSLFVQLAAADGVNVLATGLPEDHEFLLGLGASRSSTATRMLLLPSARPTPTVSTRFSTSSPISPTHPFSNPEATSPHRSAPQAKGPAVST